ncbi:MAG: carbonic anhydrase [Candidatus Binataceae bacterium]
MKKLLAALIVFSAIAIATPGPSASDLKGPPPEQALQQLLDGNNRFVQQRSIHPDARPSDAPQHPLAVILSCSDSRVPPELAFDQGVGKLFVVRVAGNTYDRLALESIEYAVGHLGTGLILVIGHDQCGAVTAAVKAYPDPKVGPMLENIYPAVRATQKAPGDKVSAAIDANAIMIAQRLRKDPALAAHIQAGDLTILPARYILATGKVYMLPPQ